MSALHMVVEIPKQVALANIALRVVMTEKVRSCVPCLLCAVCDHAGSHTAASLDVGITWCLFSRVAGADTTWHMIAHMTIHMQDEFFTRSRNEYMAVGGIMYVDLLALPPPAKHIRQWVLRQVSS